jgi:hypothetical protein
MGYVPIKLVAVRRFALEKTRLIFRFLTKTQWIFIL